MGEEQGQWDRRWQGNSGEGVLARPVKHSSMSHAACVWAYTWASSLCNQSENSCIKPAAMP
jgi:hypothetical protein